MFIFTCWLPPAKNLKKKGKEWKGKNAIGAGLLYPDKSGEHMRIDSDRQTILTFVAAASAAVVIEVGRRMEAFGINSPP